jgi:2-keto-4-pentenoate hydratase/2-oxohepta-3-ene-1,7-dioic acid hydratase (catechol pathway)
MKFVAFKNRQDTDEYRVGILSTDDEILDFTQLVSGDELSGEALLGCYDLGSGLIERVRAEMLGLPVVGLSTIHLSSPIPRPGKVICIGLNYRDHAEESGMPIPTSPIIFSKFRYVRDRKRRRHLHT